MYALINKDGFFLNHSTLGTMSCGSIDMAWTTSDREKAILMAEKAEHKGIELNLVRLG